MKKTILVVDDLDDIRKTLNSALSFDHTVIEASNGEEAIEALTDHQVDLVILDINMPVTDGWEALRVIRDDDNWPDLPVIILSVMKEPENALKGWYLGASHYLRKPFSITKLLNVVESVLTPPEENTATM